MTKAESLARLAYFARMSAKHQVLPTARSHGLAAVRAIKAPVQTVNTEHMLYIKSQAMFAFRAALKACGFPSNAL